MSFQIIASTPHLVIVIEANGFLLLYGSIINVVVQYFVIWEAFVNTCGGIYVFRGWVS